MLRWKYKLGEFKQMAFKETMIDHLEIESTIIFAESNEGREQIKKFGRDLQGDLILRNTNTLIFFSSRH